MPALTFTGRTKKVNASSSSNLYSHPEKALEEHLINVADIAQQNLRQSPANFPGQITRDRLFRLIKTCGLLHDLGKATGFFQRYLFASEEEKKNLKSMEETHHGLLSAVACFFAANAEFEQDEDLKGDDRSFLSFIAFLTVKRHHGNLEDIVDEAVLNDKEQVLMAQIESIDEKKLTILNTALKQNGLKQDITVENLKKWVMNLSGELRSIRRKLRGLGRSRRLDPYLITNYLFSLLIDADKSEVSTGKVLERNDANLDSSIVDKYKESMNFKDTFLNKLRQKAYDEVVYSPLDLEKRVYSINLPTGLGKTLTSLAFALKLKKEVHAKKGFFPRIIYSLPFLSIIEQNAGEFEKVLKAGGLDVDTSLLLKHHHLSEYTYKKDDEVYEPDDAKILIEGWNSEIIVTTFVQLFHALLSNKNKNLRKFHRLSGSIIILDEVQSIPFKYWLLVREILKTLIEQMDSYVVFVTATEPMIFSREEVFPLTDRKKYFNVMDRVVIKPEITRDISVEEFAESIEINDGRSYLFILNTIRSAKTFYNLLKQKAGEKEVAFLSTHVVPFERLRRIEKMRDGRVSIAVTTQLVEAGVDIDFNVVYRDLAPLDSINQSAGRCNRNWGKKGEVIVVSLKDEKRLYSSYIYDDVLLDMTRRILQKKEIIEEKDFLELIESYYREMQDKKSSDRSRELLSAVYSMKYTSVDETPCISDFKLIDEDYPKLDVFIELNDEAEEIWQDYIRIKEIKNIIKRRLAFSQIKADFYKYTVSIPMNVANLPPEVANFRYVNRNSLKDYYDEDTGFRCEGVTALW
jgi:CRISPR-associated endonuclease/helicase Cas3